MPLPPPSLPCSTVPSPAAPLLPEPPPPEPPLRPAPLFVLKLPPPPPPVAMVPSNSKFPPSGTRKVYCPARSAKPNCLRGKLLRHNSMPQRALLRRRRRRRRCLTAPPPPPATINCSMILIRPPVISKFSETLNVLTEYKPSKVSVPPVTTTGLQLFFPKEREGEPTRYERKY